MADDFHEQLRIGADGLYAETLRGSKRFICQSKVTADGDWYLSCTDVKDNFWEKTLSADEVAKLRKSIGLQNETWSFYFRHFHDSFSTDNMIIGDAEGDGVVLTVWVFHEGKQFAFAYKLFPSVDRHKRLTEMMLELVRVAKKAKKNEQEVVDLRHQLRKSREKQKKEEEASLSAWEPAVEAKTVQINKQQKKVGKRKPGYSLVNPGVRRKPALGAKIGEE